MEHKRLISTWKQDIDFIYKLYYINLDKNLNILDHLTVMINL